METQTGQSLDGFQFQFDGKPLVEIHNGKKLVFKDYNIRNEDHLFILKAGHLLDIIKPQVIDNFSYCLIATACICNP